MMSAEREKIYDVAIIGGGSYGTATFLTAITSGLSAVLIEQGPVGRGIDNHAANYASLGMYQPGANYIRKDLNVVKTDALDCRLLKAFAGEFLAERAFLLPIYKNYSKKIFRMPKIWEAAFRAYDEFSQIAQHPPHETISSEEFSRLEPKLRRSHLLCAVRFYEWVADPVELASAFVRAGERLGGENHGGAVFENCRVVGFEFCERGGKKCLEAAIVKNASCETLKVRARYFVNACGAWAPRVAALMGLDLRLRPTSGTSLILQESFTNNNVVVLDDDSQYLAMMPKDSGTLVGPTNCLVPEEVLRDPDLLQARLSEKIALLQTLNKFLKRPLPLQEVLAKKDPERLEKFFREYVLEVKCGLRTQLDHKGVAPRHITHAFAIFSHLDDGIANALTVAGGKLTCQMRIAKEVVEKICELDGVKFNWQIPYLRLKRNGEISRQPSPLVNVGDYRKRCGLDLRAGEDVAKEIYAAALAKKIFAFGNIAKHFFFG